MIQLHNGADGVSWDALQWVKGAVGYADCEAVELYPPDDRIVNVANMRHLWVLAPGQLMPFGLDERRDLKERA